MVRLPVGLLQLDDGRPAAQPLQPRVGVAVVAGRAGHALVPHVRQSVTGTCASSPPVSSDDIISIVEGSRAAAGFSAISADRPWSRA